jgi:ABC-type antimicrobial peptide transport system permease subunit
MTAKTTSTIGTALAVAIPCVLFAAILVGTVDWTYGFGGCALVGLGTVLSGGVSLLLTIIFAALRKPALAWKSAACLAAVIAALVAAGFVNDAQRARAQKRGEMIVTALEKHKAATGRYPASLDALVPDYIEEIPAPGLGFFTKYRFHYTADQDALAFSLTFPAPAWTEMGYESKDRLWHCYD